MNSHQHYVKITYTELRRNQTINAYSAERHSHPQVTHDFHSTDFSRNSPITWQMFCGHLMF